MSAFTCWQKWSGLSQKKYWGVVAHSQSTMPQQSSRVIYPTLLSGLETLDDIADEVGQVELKVECLVCTGCIMGKESTEQHL